MPYILELRWLKDHIPTKQGFLHTIRWKRVSWRYSRHGSILGRPHGLALSDHPLDAPSSTKQGLRLRRNFQRLVRCLHSTRPYPNKTRIVPYQQMNEGVVKVFTTRQYSRATSRSSPIGPSTGCSFINKTRIMTLRNLLKPSLHYRLQDHIPTKQGWRNVQWTFRQWGSARAPNRTLWTSKSSFQQNKD